MLHNYKAGLLFSGLLLLVLFLPNTSSLTAQNHAGDFDGTSSYIRANNVGDAISSSPGLTLMGWVYPRNASPAFPDFDGFFGFRNDATFDFYMLQLTPTNVEVRFRNSATATYNILATSLVLNEWQHIAMTYDGTTLNFYRNGVLQNTISASGSIVSFGEPLQIGSLYWTGGAFEYYMDGQVDNVQVWKEALTEAEIVDVHCRENLNDSLYPTLVCQHLLNDTTGVATTDDAIGTYNGNVFGGITFVPSGVTACDAFEVFESISICDGDSVEFNGNWLSNTGAYTDTLTSTTGIDSIVTVDLTVYAAVPTPLISQPNDSTLLSTAGDSYVWFLDGMILTGETNQELYNPVPGIYTVIVVDSNGCTSEVSNDLLITLPPSGLGDLFALDIVEVRSVYGGQISFTTSAEVYLQIYTTDGRLHFQQMFAAGAHNASLGSIPAGAILLNFRSATASGTMQFFH